MLQLRMGLAIFTLWLSLGAAAQDYVRLLQAPHSNFYEVQESFNNGWENRTPVKGQGYKQFKRLEAFWEPRLYPSGTLPHPNIAWQEAERFKAAYGHRSSRSNGEWTQHMVHDSLGYTAFSAIPGHGRVSCLELAPNDTATIYIGTPSGGLWRSTNAGQSWEPLTDDLPVLGVADIEINPSNPQIMYLATGDNTATMTYSVGVLKSTDGGNSWNTTGMEYLIPQMRNIRKLLMHPQHPDTLWATTSSGVWRSNDGASNWSLVLTGNAYDIEFKPFHPSVLYATANGGCWESIDGGATFAPTNLAANSSIVRMELAITPADPEVVYAIAASASDGGLYGFYKSTNSGNAFASTANTTNILGYFLNGGTGGQAWFDLDIAASPYNADHVYTAGINIWESSNGGDSFAPTSDWSAPGTSTYVHGDVHKLLFRDSTLFTTCDGGIFRSDDWGTSWTDLSANLTIHQIYAFAQSPFHEQKLLVGTQDVGSSYYDGQTWTTVTWGDGFNCFFDPLDSLRMYTTAHNGTFFRTTSGIDDFVQIYPNVSEQSAFQTVLTQDPSNPETFYAGFLNVWRSTDGCDSWTQLSFLGNSFPLRRIAVSPSNPQTIYATSNFLAYRSTDGGSSWQDITSGLPTFTAAINTLHIDPNNSQRLWIGFSGYAAGQKLYFSSDGGSSWENASDNLPNLPINAVLKEPNPGTGLYVGTDVGVYYSNPTLQDWVPYMEGLPNVVVNDLALVPGTQRLRAATFGRGVWEAPLYETAPPAAVEQQTNNNTLLVYPNPARSWLSIDASATPELRPDWIRVYAAGGQCVLEQELADGLHTPLQLVLRSLPPGSYTCVLGNATEQQSASFVIAR